MIVRFALIGLLLAAAGAAQAASPTPSKAQAQKQLWALEQEIYSARGRGDMRPYIENIAKDYRVWPPFSDRPTGLQNLEDLRKSMAVENKELLTMEFIDFVMNGETAVIYYRTHRTRLGNGQAVDQYYDVTHSWTRVGGVWKLMGGMARDAVKK